MKVDHKEQAAKRNEVRAFRVRLLNRYGVSEVSSLPVGPRNDYERAAAKAGMLPLQTSECRLAVASGLGKGK